MNTLKAYDIEIFTLQQGQHDFKFQVDDNFFKAFDYGLLEKGKLEAGLKLDKELAFMALEFQVKGKIELTCDRSLDKFDYPVKTGERIILKFGDEPREIADDLEIISADTLRINVAKYIYELITLAIPLKKLHPRFNQNETDTEDLIYSTRDDDEKPSEDQIDPRWEKLKNLKNN